MRNYAVKRSVSTFEKKTLRVLKHEMLPLTIFFESLTTPQKRGRNYDSQLDSDKKRGISCRFQKYSCLLLQYGKSPVLYYYRVGRLLETSFPVEKSEMIPGLSHERRKGGGEGVTALIFLLAQKRERSKQKTLWPALASLLRRRHSSGVVRCKHPELQRRTEKSSKANLTPIPKENERL